MMPWNVRSKRVNSAYELVKMLRNKIFKRILATFVRFAFLSVSRRTRRELARLGDIAERRPEQEVITP